MTLDDLQTFVALRIYAFKTCIKIPGKYIGSSVTKEEFIQIVHTLDLYQCFKYYYEFRDDGYYDIIYWLDVYNISYDEDDVDAIMYLILDSRTTKEIFYDTLKVYMLIDYMLIQTVSIF